MGGLTGIRSSSRETFRELADIGSVGGESSRKLEDVTIYTNKSLSSP